MTPGSLPPEPGERTRLVAQRRAEEAERELASFTYSVAHDLRAPLRSIDGFSQALLDDYQANLDERGQRYLRFVRESARQLGQLLDDLTGLARVMQKPLTPVAVDLSAAVRAIAAELQAAAPERRVELVVADGVVVSADAHLLDVLLRHLIGNAWKFTAPRALARIEVGRDGAACLVRDNGVGFDMAWAGKLFGAFQRLHPAAEFAGSGIGLATVQRIVRRHGGRVWAQGQVDGGATFYFTLGDEEEGA